MSTYIILSLLTLVFVAGLFFVVVYFYFPPKSPPCASFNPGDLTIQERADHWMIVEKTSNVALLDFGSSMSPDAKQNLDLAKKMLKLIQLTKVTKQCYIGNSFIKYYLVGNKAPTTNVDYCRWDCQLNFAPFDPNKLKAYHLGKIGKAGLLVDDKNIILTFQNGLNAETAVKIIQQYGFNHLCYDGPQYAPRVTFFLKLEPKD